MFARSVSLHLKRNKAAEFTQTIEREIIPCCESRKASSQQLEPDRSSLGEGSASLLLSGKEGTECEKK